MTSTYRLAQLLYASCDNLLGRSHVEGIGQSPSPYAGRIHNEGAQVLSKLDGYLLLLGQGFMSTLTKTMFWLMLQTDDLGNSN